MPECHATEYAIEYAIDQVLLDATRSIRDELLPMARALKPKKVLKTLAKSLQISTDELAQTLIELPSLVSDARIDELIACAAKGAEPDDEPEDGVAADHDGRDDAKGAKSVEGAAEDAGQLEVDVGHIEHVGHVGTVAKLLREHLEVRLREVKPSFEAAALELRDALNLPCA